MLKKEFIANSPYLPYKSVGSALLFALFFGPLGLLYSSPWGGVVMVAVAFVVLSSHYSVPIALMWVSCSIWAVMATNRHNRKLMQNWHGQKHEEKNTEALATP